MKQLICLVALILAASARAGGTCFRVRPMIHSAESIRWAGCACCRPHPWCRAAPSAECDCSNIQLTPAPVLGIDGLSYINSCVAECQGVAIVEDEPRKLHLKAGRFDQGAGSENEPAAGELAQPNGV